MRNVVNKTVEDYVSLYVDIFQLMNLPPHNRVTGRVQEFLVHSIVMNYEGWVLDSPESVEELSDRMNFKNRGEVYNYRILLKKKGLLIRRETDFILPPGLTIEKVPKSLVFKFRIVNEFANGVRQTERKDSEEVVG